MSENTKPTPRVLSRGQNPTGESAVIREDASDAELFSGTLANGRLVVVREITAGDLLYLEKTLANAGDMERSMKLAARISTGEGRVTYDDLQRLKMKDLKVITKLLTEAGGGDEDDEDEFPND